MQWPKEKDKTPYNDPQNTTQKTEDRATRTPLNIGDEVRCCWNQCLYAKKELSLDKTKIFVSTLVLKKTKLN